MSLTINYLQQVISKSRLLYTAAQVEQSLDVMAAEIEEVLTSNSKPILLPVMIGGMIPAAGLLRRLHFPLEIDYLHAGRYHGKTSGDIKLKWYAKPNKALKDRVILIVDDILDVGITLTEVVKYCKDQGAKKVYTAVLIDKCYSRAPHVIQKADFTALQVKEGYIYGYGMDYKEYLRNAPGIYMVAEEHKDS